jgi:hypothetical protein
MNRIFSILLGASLLFAVSSMPVLAEETTTSTQALLQQLQEQIDQLKTQIAALMSQIVSLREARQEVRETTAEIRTTLRLLRQLREGMTGEDVELLQEILATDPDVYPEGLVTGYFGPLTRNAVKRFQKIAGLDQIGVVGPQTLSRLNQLLTEGAGKSGKVPPGLLIAPGIRKKVDLEILEALPGQILPPGIAKKITGWSPGEEDVTPPVISDVAVADITTTSAKITWTTDEEADSKVWYDTTTPLVVTSTTPVESSADLVLDHEIVLSGLTPETDYYFIVNSTDEEDNNEISGEETFTTLTEEVDKEQACIDSGGTVETVLCCLTVDDFPNLCLVGACSCSAENSHEVKTCNCGEGKCFDGEACVSE